VTVPAVRRAHVVDAEAIARSMRKTFQAKEPKERVELPFTWRREMQHVGDSLAVCYASDKWKKDGELEIYKHIAESRNRVFCAPKFLRPFEDEDAFYPSLGPMVSFEDVPMPKHFAVLGYFEECNLCLHSEGTQERPAFAKNPADDVVVKVLVKHGMLGASKMRWSTLGDGRKDQPFLLVYSEPNRDDPGGVHMIIVGEELDVEKDGIVG
jgi:hypothetical protein